MLNKKVLAAVVLAGAAFVPSVSFGAHAEAAPCILRAHRVPSVPPYRLREHVGRGTTSRLDGAQVFVQAEPGLTPEWLELQLARHIASMHGAGSMKDCAL